MKTQPKPLKYRPFVEIYSCIDEYQDNHTRGLFLAAGYCLAGIMIRPPHRRTPDTREGEARAVILFNRALGIWRDPDPHLPPSGFKRKR